MPTGPRNREMVRLGLVLFFAVLSACGALPGPLHAQVTINADPMSSALGEATVALSGRAGVILYNPASIGDEPGVLRIATNVGWPLVVRNKWIAGEQVGTKMAISSQSIEYSLTRWRFAGASRLLEIGKPEDVPPEVAEIAESAYLLSSMVGGSYQISSRLRVGGAAKYHARHAAGIQTTTLAIDLGLQHNWTVNTNQIELVPSVGWSLTDFGRPFSIDGISLPLQSMMRLGAAITGATRKAVDGRTLVGFAIVGALSKNVSAGDNERRLEFVDGPLESLFSSFHGNLELGTHWGLEITMLEFLSVRTGYYHEPTAISNLQYQSFGFGVRLNYIAIEWSKIPSDQHPLLGGQQFWRIVGRIPIR